jgi:hypothetical protein
MVARLDSSDRWESWERLILPLQCINKIDNDYVDSMVSCLNSVIVGSCELPGNDPLFIDKFTPCGEKWWIQSGIFNYGNATLDTVQRTFNSVTESITNRMWVQGHDPRTNSTGLVYGTVNQTTTCVAFSWTWLLFPALLILTGICLVITMIQPIYEKTPLWKSSILPLLYASPGTQLMASGEADDMGVRSKGTIARLENGEGK